MADPIGFYNSGYTGGEIDAAVGQTEQNKKDIETVKRDIAANQNEISSLKENLETNTNNISNLNGIVAQQSTALNNKLDKPSGLDTVYKIVITNNSSTGILDYTDAPTGSTIMQRDANGRAQVVAGTSGKEIVNFEQLQAAIKTYKHTVIAQRNDGSMGWNGIAYFVAYSTNNLNINSVDNLKTVLGSNFMQPCSGYMKEASDETNFCELITPSGFMIRTASATFHDGIDFSNTTFTDFVTTI